MGFLLFTKKYFNLTFNGETIIVSRKKIKM